MKKFTTFLLCIISLLISLLYGLNEKYNDSVQMHSLGNLHSGIDVYVKDSDLQQNVFLDSIVSICETYDISIFRSDMIQIDGREITVKSIISNSSQYNELNIMLKNGRFPKSSKELISTFEYEDSVGQIYDLFDDDEMIICSIEYLFSHFPVSVDGSYHINCQDKDKDFILNELSALLKISKSDLIQSNYQVAYEKGPIEIIFVSIFLILLIYVLMCLFFPTLHLKTISVLKLLGYRSINIWFYLNKRILLFVCIFTVIINGLQKILISSLNVEYFINLFILQIIFFIFTILLSLIMNLIIKKYTISSMLKGYYHVKLTLFVGYALKCITFICMIFTIPLLSLSLTTTFNEYKAHKAYQQESNYVTLASFDYMDDEFQQILNGTSTLKNKMYSLFRELESTSDARFINVSNINYDFYVMNKSFIDPKAVFSESSDYPIMRVNQNALNEYQSFFKDSIDHYFNEGFLTILIPDKYRGNPEVDFVIKAILYQDENTKEEVNIDYYPTNNQAIFSQNIQLIDKDQAFIYNPIFICLHDKYLQFESSSLLVSAISNPIRIKKTDNNMKNIKKSIIENGLDKNNLHFESVFETDFQEYLTGAKKAVFISFSLLFLVVGVNILSSYFIFSIILLSRQKELFVKKILGHPLWERYKNEMIYFYTIYICGMILLLFNTKEILSKIIFILFILMDVLINHKLIRNKEKKQLSSLLKGDD